MINTIKQNKKAVLAFLLALVMVIGLIPFTATEVQAVTIPVGDITTNDSFGNGDAWETGDKIRLLRWVDDRHTNFFLTAEVTEDGAVTWTPDKKLYWDGKGEHTLVASYPNMNLPFQDFGIPVDQSDLQKLKEADCMNAMWKGNPTTEPINLKLKHRLSMVTVTYTLASEFEPDTVITPEVHSNTQYMFFNVNTLERQNVAWEEGDDIWVKAYKHEGENGEKKFTAIVSPDAYAAGDEFIRIKIGDQVLTVKMPEDITFAEGTHYTFNLKVGKNKVEIETVTVNGDFPGGWNEEVNLDGTTDTIGIVDEGKTTWKDEDLVVIDFTSDKYGNNMRGVRYSDNVWTMVSPIPAEQLSYLENEAPTVNAIYSPIYFLSDFGEVLVSSHLDGDIAEGEYEYIKIGCTLSGKTITADFSNVTRNYSRLRIVAQPYQKLRVTVKNFLPAGSDTELATGFYDLTADANGNAYLYGIFAEGGSISVHDGDNYIEGSGYAKLAEYTFESVTETGTSYALDAMPVIDGTLGGKTTATEEEVNALVEQLKAYVDNGITTIIVTGSNPAMIDMGSWINTAIGEAIYRLSKEESYNGKIDLILPDVTEIVDQEFYDAHALNSITLPKVTKIGDEAFQDCYYLKQLTFGSVLTEIVETGGGMFSMVGHEVGNCDLVLNCGQMNGTSIPDLTANTWTIRYTYEFKSITLTHTGECDECKAQ